jgi:copper resistance protein C
MGPRVTPVAPERRTTLRLPRRLLPLATLVASLALPTLVLGHVELASTSPADGERLDEPPTEVVITFDGELNPEASEFTVTDASGTEVGSGGVDLEVADRNELRGAVEITEPGVYVVSWTGTGTDGHEETGEFRFGYQADVEPVAPAQPNTAVATADGRAAATAWGAALIWVAAAIAVRGVRSRGNQRPR